MKRKLISQMCNEWRSNVWMVIELIIVGIVLWAIFSLFAGLTYLHKKPEGINFDNIYCGIIGYVPKTATSYTEYSDSLHSYSTDLEMLKNKLKGNPYIESLGTGINAIPYNYNFYGTLLQSMVADTIQTYSANRRTMSPDMVRTLQLTGSNGENSETLATMVEEGKILISKVERNWYNSTPEKWVGHNANQSNDSSTVYEVGALFPGFRRTDYEPANAGVMVIYNPDELHYEIAFKIKDGKDREFKESLKGDMTQFGNVYIRDIQSIEDIKNNAHHDISVVYRNMTACALFLLLAVFLGFLGAFWYRTQQRIPELALRKVNGATNSDIFRRFLGEGMILLAISALPIIGVCIFLLKQFDLEDAWLPMPEILFISMIGVSLLALALIISAGIAIPARKAMNVNPAAALKEQ